VHGQTWEALATPVTGQQPIRAMKKALLFSADPGIPLLGPSGSSAHLRGVHQALQAHAFDVHVAIPQREDQRGSFDEAVGYEITTRAYVQPRGWGRWRDRAEMRHGRALAAAALQQCPNVELIWERFSLFCDGGVRIAKQQRKAGRPIVHIIELNSPIIEERGTIRSMPFARKKRREILHSADHVVAVSQWLRDWAIHEIGCAPHKVHYIPNGTALKPSKQRDLWREKWQLHGTVVGFVGSMKPWHGLEQVLRIAENEPTFTFLIIGEGPQDIPAHPRIRHMGRLNGQQLAHAIACFDVAIAPYSPDSPPYFCPLKVVDYLSQGVPVVATRTGDCPHLVFGDRGQCLISDDPVKWKQALHKWAAHRVPPYVRPWSTVVSEALSAAGVSASPP